MHRVRNRDHLNELFWGPWADFDRIRGELTGLLGSDSARFGGYPPMNVWSADEGVLVSVELAGIDPESLDVNVEGQVLTLRGERNPVALADSDRLRRRERAVGSFARSLKLPFHVEVGDVEATYERGVLEIRLPRAASERPRRITVHAS